MLLVVFMSLETKGKHNESKGEMYTVVGGKMAVVTEYLEVGRGLIGNCEIPAGSKIGSAIFHRHENCAWIAGRQKSFNTVRRCGTDAEREKVKLPITICSPIADRSPVVLAAADAHRW